MTGKEKKDEYIRVMSKQTGLSEEDCLELLKEKFKTYNPRETSTYSTYLFKTANERFEQSLIEKEKNAGKVDISCPYHPEATTHGSRKWYSPYTKRHGWACSVGGDRCYIRSKMDAFLEFKGKQPIDWEYFDANKEIILKERLENV